LFASLNGTIARAQAVQNTTYSYLYDAMGNPTQLTDPLGRVSNQSYDPLNRVKQQLQPPPATGAARPAVNYTYDGRDHVAAVSDPRALVTTYATTGLGDAVGLVSPDTGATARTHDAAGNLASATDARGKVTSYQYDALNRLRRIDYATGAPSVFEYDGGEGGAANAIGRLTKMTDESGQTAYRYDQTGRMLSKTQTVNAAAGALARTVRYAYDAGGRVGSLTYPSGNRIDYEYGPAGRVSGIVLNPADAETSTPPVLLKQIVYAPFGAVQSWMWGNSSAAAPNPYARTFDLDGRVTSYPLGSIGAASGGAGKVLDRVTRTLSYDAASRIAGMTHVGAGLGANLDQAYGYDDLGRLTSYTGDNASQAYKYDAGGNRTQLSVGAAAYANTVAAGSNRLAGTTGPVPAKSNTYDAAGNLATDGVAALPPFGPPPALLGPAPAGQQQHRPP
jgi:YD repeat-containing protein